MLVLTEESYKISVWCREILDGIRQESRKRRLSVTVSCNAEDIVNESGSTVIIVGAETEWLAYAVKMAKACGKHPIILSNQMEKRRENGVSRVSEDIFGSMSEITALLSGRSSDGIALYAVNPCSASDSFKRDAFLELGGQNADVFINEGSLKECFEDFYTKYKTKKYGGIVCANDFAAISLIRHMKEKGQDISGTDIISYSDTLISRCTSPTVSTVRANFKSFGALAFMIHDCVSKGEAINGMHIYCTWDIIHRETSSGGAYAANTDAGKEEKVRKSFYGDPELMEMMRIEELLTGCDEVDLKILEAILNGKKTQSIAEECYLTESAVKYRIGKMKDICKVESRASLRDFLLKYLSRACDRTAR